MSAEADAAPAVLSASKDGQFETIVTKATGHLVIVMIAAMVGVIWVSVFTRYVLSDAIGWGEQVAKYLMIWATFLASSLGIRQGAHIAADLLASMLPAPLSRLCARLSTLLVGGFLVLCIYYGVMFTLKVVDHRDPMVWDMSLAWAYAAIPVGSLAMLLQLYFVSRKAPGQSAAATVL